MGSWFSSDDKRQEKALQKRDDEVRENDEHDMAEKGLPYDRLDELQVEAISYLKNRKLVVRLFHSCLSYRIPLMATSK